MADQKRVRVRARSRCKKCGGWVNAGGTMVAVTDRSAATAKDFTYHHECLSCAGGAHAR